MGYRGNYGKEGDDFDDSVYLYGSYPIAYGQAPLNRPMSNISSTSSTGHSYSTRGPGSAVAARLYTTYDIATTLSNRPTVTYTTITGNTSYNVIYTIKNNYAADGTLFYKYSRTDANES
jgi:hypothetical protein